MPRVESLGVRNAQREHLTGFRHHDEERIRVDVSGQNHVFAQTERVLSIDLRQIEHVSALILGSALERGTGRLVHSPSFSTVLSGGGRSVQRLALAAVEFQDFMGATPVLPNRTIRSDGHTARARYPHLVRRRNVDLRLARLRWIQSAFEAYESGIVLADSRTPDAAVFGVDGIRVTAESDPMVLFGIDGFIRLGPLRDLAIAVRVEDGGTPSLRCSGIVGFIEGCRVYPADRAVLAENKRVLVVEFVVVGGKTSVNHRELFRLRVVHFDLPRAWTRKREVFRVFIRSIFAKRGLLLRRANSRR